MGYEKFSFWEISGKFFRYLTASKVDVTIIEAVKDYERRDDVK